MAAGDYFGSYGDGTGAYGDGRGYESYGTVTKAPEVAAERERVEAAEWEAERGPRRLQLATWAVIA